MRFVTSLAGANATRVSATPTMPVSRDREGASRVAVVLRDFFKASPATNPRFLEVESGPPLGTLHGPAQLLEPRLSLHLACMHACQHPISLERPSLHTSIRSRYKRVQLRQASMQALGQLRLLVDLKYRHATAHAPHGRRPLRPRQLTHVPGRQPFSPGTPRPPPQPAAMKYE